jgi:Rne/Rng family ribonuclease
MAKEIIVNAEKEQTRIAIVEDGELVELFIENPENERTIGDICLARVRKIMPSIQAAFVDIGQKQDAFLHFSDLSANLPELLEFLNQPNPEVGKFKPQTATHKLRGTRRRPQARAVAKEHEVKEGEEEKAEHHRAPADAHERGHRRSAQRRSKNKQDLVAAKEEPEKEAEDNAYRPPESYLKRDQRILVKIFKEPIASKGSRVSTDISLAGRFLVLVPLADYIAVSKKIVSYKERRRLRVLAKSLVPDGFGVIVRTVAQGKNAKALDTDLRLLIDKWRKIEKKLAGFPEPPLMVHEDVNLVSSVIRDLFSDDYDRILVDDQRLYRNIKSYIQAVAPHMTPAVQLYNGKKPIFEATQINGEVEKAFQSRVDLPTGGYLFIERTEAMYVIDVNSGRSGRGMTQEANSLKVNLEAARVITKQIRLRDLGGIIVVDFIDLKEEANRQKVYEELKREFKKDRAVTKVLPMSDFGLVQITRQRLRPSITAYATPKMNGQASDGAVETASVKALKEPSARNAAPDRLPQPALTPEVLVQQMEEWIVAAKTKSSRRAVTLVVHPFTAAYLNRKVPNYTTRWFMKHLFRVRLEIDEKMSPMSFRFLDPRTGEDITSSFEVAVPA